MHDWVSVPQAWANEVRLLLRTSGTKFSPGGPRGFQSRKAIACFYRTRRDGSVRTHVGLVYRVADHLRARGVEVRLDDRRRFTPALEPDWKYLAGCRPALGELLGNAAERARGFYAPGDREELAACVAGLCWLFPRARTYIAERNLVLADDLYRRLICPLHSQIQRHTEGIWATPWRRVVGTPAKLAVLNPDDWDLVIVADARTALAVGTIRSVRRLGHRRWYGFVGPGNWPGQWSEQLLLEAVFGAPLIPPPSGPAVVVYLPVPPSHTPPSPQADPLVRKRQAVWGCAPRNDYLARVALATRAGDTAALAELGLGRLADRLGLRLTEPVRTAVLVEGPEHGRALLQQLPGWRFVSRPPREHDPGWGGYDPAAWVHDPDGYDRVILTSRAVRAADALDVDVLVRADGGSGPLRLPVFPGPGRDREQVLVDPADNFDPTAEVATRGRARAYRDAGWSIAAAPDWVTR